MGGTATRSRWALCGRRWARVESQQADNTVSATSLIRPFSLLSLPFFRKKTSFAPTDALATLRIATTRAEFDETIDFDIAVKAMIALQGFIRRTRPQIKATNQADFSVDELHEAYLRGFHIAARAASSGKWHPEMGQAARECLSGYTRLDPRVGEEAKDSWRPHLVGAIFSATLEESYLFAPIFHRPRQLTDEIQHHHIQRSGGKKALRDTAPSQPDPVRDHEEEAEHLIDLLDLFERHVEEYETLPGPTPLNNPTKLSKAKLKTMDDTATRRPMRIALETRITKCELATALASADIVNMKARAREKSRSPTPELLSDAGSSVDSEEVDVKRDIKPDIRNRSSKSYEPGPSREGDDGGETQGGGIVWDERAEEILYECLNHSCRLLEQRHSAVLTNAPQRSDWLGTDSVAQTHKSPVKGDAAHVSDSDSDLESESDSDADLSSSQAGATPLRAIFRLQDRYEELRLAVWLSLPPDSRGKMSAYMRGAPTQTQMLKIHGPDMGDAKFKEKINGRIGEAWDKFGLALLKKFDRQVASLLGPRQLTIDSRELQRHGLDPEKLDKWEELVLVRGGKKAKKPRKTV